MSKKLRIVIGVVVLGLLIPFATLSAWLYETNAAARYEALAKKAAENGDWEQAAAYAEQANADELRLEAAYRTAEQALNSGDYAVAKEGFAALGAYRDAQTRVQECSYAQAEAKEREGDDAAARDAFFALVPYADSLDRYRACCYRIAQGILDSGDTREAFRAFSELIPYADSEARAIEIAVALTGETDPERAVAFAKGYSEESWQQLEQLASVRDALRTGRIAAGNAHAVFLFADGHAEAAGDNTYGQCAVAAFWDVSAIAAGYRHTVGLKKDGTVVAAGDNSCGQCDVAGWTNVVSVACGAWDTFAIRADGTLLHCGFSTFPLDGWTDLSALAACETALIGVRSDGTLLCTAAEGRYAGGSYCGAAVTTGAAFALTKEGTVRCQNEAVAAWTDILALRSSATVLTGIRADGTLAVEPLMPCRAAYLEALRAETDVVEVAPAGTFALVLHRDGTVTACGAVSLEIAAFLAHEPVL